MVNETLRHLYQCALNGWSLRMDEPQMQHYKAEGYIVVYAWKKKDKHFGYFSYRFYLHPNPDLNFEQVFK